MTSTNKIRLAAHKDFREAVDRIRVLYEVTMHSYNVTYESGRQRLRNKAERNSEVELNVGGAVVKRRLDLVTHHAKDVYPDLLRSTLLVRLVAGYEAFLVDVVEEVSRRSQKPFLTSDRLDFSQEQLLTIDAREGIFPHLVRRTLRNLNGGGLKELKKFYDKQFNTKIAKSPDEILAIEEIHERRHIYVHRAGYADADYVRKYPKSGIVEGQKIPVNEEYLLTSIKELTNSALHIKIAVEGLFPAPPVREYRPGSLSLPDKPDHFNFVSFQPVTVDGRTGFDDLSLPIQKRGSTLRDITVWLSDDQNEIRLLVGGTSSQMKFLGTYLHDLEKRGHVRSVSSFKVKR